MSITRHKFFLLKAGIIVGSGGLIFGYDIGVIAGALNQLRDEFNLSGFEVGLVVAILYAGAIFGSIIGGPMCDYFGRWKTIHFQNLVFIVGAIITASSHSLAGICVGRFIVGIASAVSGIADVPYLTEISPPDYRGFLTCQYEILVCVGVLLSFIVDLIFSGVSNGWRIDFAIPSIMALFQTLGMLLLPESPKWLIEKNRLDEAKKALAHIYGEHNIEHLDVNDIVEYKKARQKAAAVMGNDEATTVQHTASVNTVTSSQRLMNQSVNTATTNQYTSNMYGQFHVESVSEFSKSSGNTAHHSSRNNSAATLTEEIIMMKLFNYPLNIVIAIQILAQFTGGVVIRNYAPIIFENSGISTTMALVYNVILGVVKLLFTVVSVYYIDSTGRVLLLFYGVTLVFIGMLFLMIASVTSAAQNPVVYIIGCSLCLGGYGIGYGPIPWILSSEMFPTLIRGKIMSISLIASNVSQLITNLVFVLMLDGMTPAGTFGFFLLMNVFTFLYVKAVLVESKEKAPEDILKLLQVHYNNTHKTISYYCVCFKNYCKGDTENDKSKLLGGNAESYAYNKNNDNQT